MVGRKESIHCLKTQTAQGKLHIELKNELCDKALLCTSRGGGILKAHFCSATANVVEQIVFRDQEQSPQCQEHSQCGGILLFLPFLNYNIKVPKSGEERIRQQEKGENSGKVHCIKVERNFLHHSEVILWSPTGKFFEGFTLAKVRSCCHMKLNIAYNLFSFSHNHLKLSKYTSLYTLLFTKTKNKKHPRKIFIQNSYILIPWISSNLVEVSLNRYSCAYLYFSLSIVYLHGITFKIKIKTTSRKDTICISFCSK